MDELYFFEPYVCHVTMLIICLLLIRAENRLLEVILRVTKNIEDPVMGMSLCLK